MERCRVVSAAINLDFLDRNRSYTHLFQVAPHLSARGWVDPVPDPLLHRKSGSPRNRIRNLWICSHGLWPLDHRGSATSYDTLWYLSGRNIVPPKGFKRASTEFIELCNPGPTIHAHYGTTIYRKLQEMIYQWNLRLQRPYLWGCCFQESEAVYSPRNIYAFLHKGW
jgi:hypothetical protein